MLKGPLLAHYRFIQCIMIAYKQHGIIVIIPFLNVYFVNNIKYVISIYNKNHYTSMPKGYEKEKYHHFYL